MKNLKIKLMNGFCILALSSLVVVSGCGGKGPNEATRVIEPEGNENTHKLGPDSTNSDYAASSAAQAELNTEGTDRAQTDVAEKMDTTETYGTVTGRTSTNNTGTSAGNGDAGGPSGGGGTLNTERKSEEMNAGQPGGDVNPSGGKNTNKQTDKMGGPGDESPKGNKPK
jgi:hypothetical protein